MDPGFTSLISHEAHTLIVDGVSIAVDDGVFTPDPALTHSPHIIIGHLPDLHDKDVLDLGCGSGVFSLAAARRGARSVVAADVSSLAIQNARANIHKNALNSKIQVRQSDLFSNVPEKFDLILANLPILEEGIWERDPLEIIERFLLEYSAHLRDGGVAWLTWWGSFSPIKPLLSLLEEKKVRYTVVQEEALGYQWSLFQIQKSTSWVC